MVKLILLSVSEILTTVHKVDGDIFKPVSLSNNTVSHQIGKLGEDIGNQ